MCSYYYFSRHYQIAVKIKPLYLTHYKISKSNNTDTAGLSKKSSIPTRDILLHVLGICYLVDILLLDRYTSMRMLLGIFS